MNLLKWYGLVLISRGANPNWEARVREALSLSPPLELSNADQYTVSTMVQTLRVLSTDVGSPFGLLRAQYVDGVITDVEYVLTAIEKVQPVVVLHFSLTGRVPEV